MNPLPLPVAPSDAASDAPDVPFGRSVELHWLAAEGVMTFSADARARLFRMEEARRQIQRQLDQIDRQITRRMTALIPKLQPKRAGYRHGRPPDPKTFLERYRANLAALTAERQPKIDALSRKLARQDRAIAAFRARHGLELSRPA